MYKKRPRIPQCDHNLPGDHVGGAFTETWMEDVDKMDRGGKGRCDIIAIPGELEEPRLIFENRLVDGR